VHSAAERKGGVRVSQGPARQAVWQSGRRLLVLIGWFFVILGNSVLWMGNADMLMDYSFHKDLLAHLRVGKTTAQDIQQLLGQPKHTFEGHRFLVPGRWQVLHYSVAGSGESSVYLYLDEQGKLAYVDLWHTGKWSILLHYIAILSCVVITGTWLLALTALDRKEQRQALAWWLVTALIGLLYVGSAVLLSAEAHRKLGIVVVPLGVLGWFAAATKTLATLTSVDRKGMLQKER
jgi:hypothetical protein